VADHLIQHSDRPQDGFVWYGPAEKRAWDRRRGAPQILSELNSIHLPNYLLICDTFHQTILASTEADRPGNHVAYISNIVKFSAFPNLSHWIMILGSYMLSDTKNVPDISVWYKIRSAFIRKL
jgi:hypothetical protein